ncbi:MAG: hypothetical protein IPO83_09960 [Chitinophagaceae bacterium]|nr:hypothetical protein [Chitinophagaceae bacterium]
MARVNKFRFHRTFPISFSPWDAKELYCTSQMVHRSANGGMSWETISPDLTRNDVTKQQQSGGRSRLIIQVLKCLVIFSHSRNRL